MDIKIVTERLKKYGCHTPIEEKQALREIAQHIILSALARADFFKKAGLVADASLRVAHGLNRFSEELNFWPLQSSMQIDWPFYLQAICDELDTYAFRMQIDERERTAERIKREFLNKSSMGKVFTLSYGTYEKIKIDFEIEPSPFLGATFESVNLDFPYPFSIAALDRSSVFAQVIAALFGGGGKEERGRHWYDFIWCVGHQWGVNLDLLSHLLDTSLSFPKLLQKLTEWIPTREWKLLQRDVMPFLPIQEHETLSMWSPSFFLGYVEMMGENLQPKVVSLGKLIAEGKGLRLFEEVRNALQAGASANDHAHQGHRPLQLALMKGHKEVAKLLIECGADPNYRDRSGLTPLQAAVNHSQFELAQQLIDEGAHFHPSATSAFDPVQLQQFLQRKKEAESSGFKHDEKNLES